MDQQLILGILLIVVGIAVGLIAAAVVVNRRIDAREAAEAEADPETGEAEPSHEAEAAAEIDAEPGEAEPAAEAGAAAEDDPEPGEAEPAVEAEAAAEDEPEPEEAEPAVMAEAASSPSGSLLGELHRDPATGVLFLKAGDREFRSASDIDDQSQRDRLAGAATELLAWFEKAARAPAAAVSTPASDMVQAIDQILQRSLEQSGSSARGVRLIQDVTGGVKVLIGVKSYEVEEVPDEEVRNLIRQAVAEWEGQQ